MDSYEGRDPRLAPFYRVSEAAHYLSVPVTTLRAWAFGQSAGQHPRFKAVLVPPQDKLRRVSFINLVEAHVLDALRRDHKIPLQTIRRAIAFLRRSFPESKHPLVDHDFATDGLSLLVEKTGSLINANREGQLEIRRVLEAYLSRIERDSIGEAVKLYPFTRRRTLDEPRHVVIDPRVQFGRPVLVSSAIPTAVIAQRYKAGESIQDLAGDYDRPHLEIEEAIRCELAA